MEQIWIRKHTPKDSSEIVGQQSQITEVKDLIKNYKKGSKPIFIYGGRGNGKTASVLAIARELNYELVELNASDERKKKEIIEILSGVVSQQSLFGSSKIILIDELEGLSGMRDRGAISGIADIAKMSSFPIVMVANDAYNDKLKPARKISELVAFNELSVDDVQGILERIAKKENIDYEEKAIRRLARVSKGDARAGINDLQSSTAATGKLTIESVEVLSDRDETTKIEAALAKVFKSTDLSFVMGAFDDVAEKIDQIFLWVESNMPKEYLEPEHLQRGFENLSLADVFYGRIRKWQYYRFYVYCYNLLTAGIALSKDKRYPSQPKYKATSRLLKIWMANVQNAKRKAIAQKLAVATHTSARQSFGYVPYYQGIFKHDKVAAKQITEELDLSKEEVEWLKK